MKWIKTISITFFTVIFIGLLIPQGLIIPVKGATPKDWHPKTFWYYPWGKSITHKGIDVFAPKNTPVIAPTSGWVFYSGKFKYGGNVVLMLGPKWRVHYFAHLENNWANTFSFYKKSSPLGTVGDSGNAKGKAPHLHYSILSLIPYPWLIDSSPQGWKKMFYLNPTKQFSN